MTIDRILCPVDFSDYSARAYDYAYSLALQYHAKLIVLHSVEPLISIYRDYISQPLIDNIFARQTEEARKIVRQLSEKHGGDVAVDVIVQWGYPSDTILAFAEDRKADLIVMGTHGRRGLDRVTMGSTTERVLRQASCAVLAVREPVREFVNPENPERPVHLRKVLCCVDFSEHSPRALEYAFSLAFQYQAEITLLHVQEDGKDEAETLRSVEALIPADARDWAKPIALVRRGKPYQEIIDQASQAQTDLIVMGVRGRNAVDLLLFGSTTHRVIQLGPCPVLVVPAKTS